MAVPASCIILTKKNILLTRPSTPPIPAAKLLPTFPTKAKEAPAKAEILARAPVAAAPVALYAV